MAPASTAARSTLAGKSGGPHAQAGTSSSSAAAAAAAALEALALDLRLQPGAALGPFTLGIPLWHTLDYLRSNPAHFPKVSLVLPPPPPTAATLTTAPATSTAVRKKGSSSGSESSTAGDGRGADAILVSILPHLHLVFNAHSQRLQLITFHFASPASGHDPSYRPIRIAYGRSLVYDSTVLLAGTAAARSSSAHGPSVTLTRTSIHQTFGPTYPPRRLSGQGEFVVSYPGVAFTFPDSAGTGSAKTNAAADAAGSAGDELDKHTPASAFHIFAGNDLLHPAHVLLPPATSRLLPSYAAAGGSSATSRLASAAAHNAVGPATAAEAPAVPPACLKAVVRPGHSVVLHLFSHAPAQPFSLAPHTSAQKPSALLDSIATECAPALQGSSPGAQDPSVSRRDSPTTAAVATRSRSPTPPTAEIAYPHGARTLRLVLGQTTAQDVLAELGAPQRRFEKVDERLDIHSFAAMSGGPHRQTGAGAHAGAGNGRGDVHSDVLELARRRIWRAANLNAEADDDGVDFEPGAGDGLFYENPTFWNYFDLGIDLLFSSPALTPAAVAAGADSSGPNGLTRPLQADTSMSGAGGVLLKIIVHSNVPGSALFQRYNRCPWVVVAPSAAASGEVSFHEPIAALTSLLRSTDERIELDRATDADFLPAASRSSTRDRSGSASSRTARGGTADTATAGPGRDSAAAPLKLDVRTWLYGFENRTDEDVELPEGGLIAEADAAGRVCSVLIY